MTIETFVALYGLLAIPLGTSAFRALNGGAANPDARATLRAAVANKVARHRRARFNFPKVTP